MSLLIAPASQAQLGVSITATSTHQGDGPWTLGYSFDVTSAFTVRSLGAWDFLDDGLNEAHDVGIWDAGGTLLASATVGSGTSGALLGGFRMQNITPFTLAIGNGYRVGANWSNSQTSDRYAHTTVVTNGPGINYVYSAYVQSGPLTDPTQVNGNTSGYFGGNFAGDVVVATPEPASMLLLGTGLVGVLGFARRRRQA